MSGKEFLARLRRRKDSVAVLILTATGSIHDKVTCLDAGADDYLVKPVDAREMVARIKAIIRRYAGDSLPDIVCGDLLYNLDTRQFRLAEKHLLLRPREHTILETFILRQGKIISKVILMDHLFGHAEEPSADAIDIYIHRIRKHLALSSAEITTIRGLGYIIKIKSDISR